MKIKVRQVFREVMETKLFRAFLLMLGVLVIGTVGVMFFEEKVTSIVDAFWWAIVTATTVGYGDIAPVSPVGRVIGVFLMIFGIGTLGVFTASISSYFVEHRIKEDRGMKEYDFTDHYIICEWSERTREIINELRVDERTKNTPVVIISDRVEHKPLEDDLVGFIRGQVNDETLKRANIKDAQTAIILGDEGLDPTSRDARVVLAGLTIESLNPEIYTIAELVEAANVSHCKHADINEIIVGNELVSMMISSSAKDHGLSKIVSDILSSQYGHELVKRNVPPDLAGKPYLEALNTVKKRYDATLVGIQHENRQLTTNPPVDYPVKENDRLIIIADTGKKKI
jgi:voltage-gated potassium channel